MSRVRPSCPAPLSNPGPGSRRASFFSITSRSRRMRRGSRRLPEARPGSPRRRSARHGNGPGSRRATCARPGSRGASFAASRLQRAFRARRSAAISLPRTRSSRHPARRCRSLRRGSGRFEREPEENFLLIERRRGLRRSARSVRLATSEENLLRVEERLRAPRFRGGRPPRRAVRPPPF